MATGFIIFDGIDDSLFSGLRQETEENPFCSVERVWNEVTSEVVSIFCSAPVPSF